MVPIAAVAGAAVIGGGILFFAGGSGSKSGEGGAPPLANVAARPSEGSKPEAPRADVAARPSDGSKPEAPRPPASAPAAAATRPAPDPKAALRAEFAKRFAAAKAAAEAGALLEAAKFAEEGGLAAEAFPVYEAVLGIDPDRLEARSALGYTKYEGQVEEFRGKWLNSGELSRAKEAEAAIRAEAERWTKDDFMKTAAGMKGGMESLAGEANLKVQFFVDTAAVPRPYLIAVQESYAERPAELGRSVGRVLDALYRRFYEEYGEPLGIRPLEVPVPVWVFNDAEAYEKVHEKDPRFAPESSKHVGGYYRGALGIAVGSGEETDLRTSGFLYLWDSDDLEGVAMHEGTHQLIGFNGKSRLFGGGQTPWFQEGIAEYWAGYKKTYEPGTKKYHFDIGHLTRRLVDQRWKLARTSFESEEEADRFTLRGLLDFGYGDFLAARASEESAKPDPKQVLKVGLVYAQGWTLCQFLNRALEGKYRKGFFRYVREELNGNGGPEAFARCFGLKTDEDWSRMEEEWQTYVLEDLKKEAVALHKG
ncbi:MAG TPA: hypothetical protein VFI25_04850 [Planctomycetota bacterium]|jgi:hypothetical protein|nr:hypothetical protein [Planctomycetota bacterium]